MVRYLTYTNIQRTLLNRFLLFEVALFLKMTIFLSHFDHHIFYQNVTIFLSSEKVLIISQTFRDVDELKHKICEKIVNTPLKVIHGVENVREIFQRLKRDSGKFEVIIFSKRTQTYLSSDSGSSKLYPW